MQQLLQSIGATLYPLTTADDAADLMEAAARVPIATPRRSVRIVQFLSSSLRMARATAYEIAEFFTRSEQEGPRRFEEVASLIPPGDGQILVTDRTTCIVCDGPLEEATGHHGRVYSASPKLFSQDGVVSSTLLWLRCSKCKCQHYLSYAVGGDLLPEGTARVYPGWAEAKYTHVTDETVFETRTLLRYRNQCLHSHTSFLAFARENEFLSIHSSPAVKAKAWAIRLAHVWRALDHAGRSERSERSFGNSHLEDSKNGRSERSFGNAPLEDSKNGRSERSERIGNSHLEDSKTVVDATRTN